MPLYSEFKRTNKARDDEAKHSKMLAELYHAQGAELLDATKRGKSRPRIDPNAAARGEALVLLDAGCVAVLQAFGGDDGEAAEAAAGLDQLLVGDLQGLSWRARLEHLRRGLHDALDRVPHTDAVLPLGETEHSQGLRMAHGVERAAGDRVPAARAARQRPSNSWGIWTGQIVALGQPERYVFCAPTHATAPPSSPTYSVALCARYAARRPVSASVCGHAAVSAASC